MARTRDWSPLRNSSRTAACVPRPEITTSPRAERYHPRQCCEWLDRRPASGPRRRQNRRRRQYWQAVALRTSRALNAGPLLPQRRAHVLRPEQLATPTCWCTHRPKANREPPPPDASLPGRSSHGNRCCASALRSVLRRSCRRAVSSGMRGSAQRGRSSVREPPQGRSRTFRAALLRVGSFQSSEVHGRETVMASWRHKSTQPTEANKR